MIDQYNTSSTQSPRDSFLSDTNAYHAKPIPSPRSYASCLRTAPSQSDAPKPATLTAEALADLSSADKNEAATYKIIRIKDFLHRLPDPEDPSNSPPDTDLDILEAEFEERCHHYKTEFTSSTPTARFSRDPDPPLKAKPQTRRLSTTIPQTSPQPYHTPLCPQDMHLYHRFQLMQSAEPYAEFWRHRAWLTLQYDKDQKVALFVGVDTKEHAIEIHRHMLWLRDKWLGRGCGLFYHVMGFEDDEEEEVVEGKKV